MGGSGDWRRCVVTIHSRTGERFGAGYLIAADVVLTCAHVVADAVGIPREDKAPPQDAVAVKFPFLDRPHDEAGLNALAVESGWFPPGEGVGPRDIAILRLERPLCDRSCFLAPLTGALEIKTAPFDSYGAPSTHPKLTDLHGRVESENAGGQYRLSTEKGHPIEPGCSGAPVVDCKTGQVLGLIVEEEIDRERRSGR